MRRSSLTGAICDLMQITQASRNAAYIPAPSPSMRASHIITLKKKGIPTVNMCVCMRDVCFVIHVYYTVVPIPLLDQDQIVTLQYFIDESLVRKYFLANWRYH